jgi:hypothetical protein
MDYTTNLNLKKPNGEVDGDFVDIADINGNMDDIDAAIGDHITDTDIHVTAEKQAEWDGYDARLDLQERLLTATIPTTGWSGSAPYSVVVTVTGLTDSRPDINPIYSSTLATARLEKEAWSNAISYIDCTTNTMTVTCLDEIPTTAINVELVGG